MVERTQAPTPEFFSYTFLNSEAAELPARIWLCPIEALAPVARKKEAWLRLLLLGRHATLSSSPGHRLQVFGALQVWEDAVVTWACPGQAAELSPDFLMSG